jgi:hypothetical protein
MGVVCASRASIRCQVNVRTATSANPGRIAHTTSLRGDADGTSVDLFGLRAANVDRSIASSAITHAIAAIQKIVSASG